MRESQLVEQERIIELPERIVVARGALQQCPELIQLDINMPVMDGFGFLEELQQLADLSSTPLSNMLLSSSQNE